MRAILIIRDNGEMTISGNLKNTTKMIFKLLINAVNRILNKADIDNLMAFVCYHPKLCENFMNESNWISVKHVEPLVSTETKAVENSQKRA